MKKNYFLLLMLLGFAAGAQVVTIPDANFKARLIQLGKDTNGDGEIQLSEAQAVTTLYLSYPYNIASLAGIESFTNLTSLNVPFHPITDLNLSGLSQLATLSVGDDLVTLNLSGCSALTQLIAGSNALVTLDISGCSSLINLNLGVVNNLTNFTYTGCVAMEVIYINGSSLTSIDITAMPNMRELTLANSGLTSVNAQGCALLEKCLVRNNNITTINLTGCTALEDLNVRDNDLVSLDIPNLESLVWLDFDGNPLTTVNLSGCSSLPAFDVWPITTISSLNVQGCAAMAHIYCSSNQLTSLDLSGLSNLQTLRVDGNNLTEINLEGCTSLLNVNFSNNNVTNIDLSDAANLWQFNCSNNELVSLNLMNNSSLDILDFNNNEPLETLFIKNGNQDDTSFSGCPNLYYICADANEIEVLMSFYPDINVNSYCSFVPGGNYNTITGTIRLDVDNNGCDAGDTVLPNVKVNIEGSEQTGITYTNAEGVYTYYAAQESVNITPELTIPQYYMLEPGNATEVFDSLNNTATVNFCVTPDGVHPDLDVVLLPVFDARPGFDATYKLIVHNKGTEMQSGTIQLQFNDVLIDYIEALPSPLTVTEGNLEWDFENLVPFQSFEASLTFNVNTPLEVPAVNIDDILAFTATLITTETDETPDDNTYQFDQVVIGSYDPNDKQVAEGETITPEQTGEYLHYLIRFQNTGTAEAINVVVKDMLAENLDWSTFTPVSASHPHRITLTNGNKAEFFFEGINLPAEEDNEPASHGYIAFKIKPAGTVAVGDVLENTAEIYFDYNAPIITNTVTTSIEVLSNTDFKFTERFTLYPNPATNNITLSAKQLVDVKTINIYSITGRMIISKPIFADSPEHIINTSSLQSGTYLVEVITSAGRSVEKFIKM